MKYPYREVFDGELVFQEDRLMWGTQCLIEMYRKGETLVVDVLDVSGDNMAWNIYHNVVNIHSSHLLKILESLNLTFGDFSKGYIL